MSLGDYLARQQGGSRPDEYHEVGTVTQVSPLLVAVGADSTGRPVSAKVADYAPLAGDLVLVLIQGAARTVLGALTGTQPWRAAWGKVAHATKTSDQTGISGVADISGLSLTWTAVAGRLYRVSGLVLCFQNTSAGIAEIRIADGSNNQYAVWGLSMPASTYASMAPSWVLSGLSGSVTFKLRGFTSAGTLTIQANGSQPSYVIAEDIGAA